LFYYSEKIKYELSTLPKICIPERKNGEKKQVFYNKTNYNKIVGNYDALSASSNKSWLLEINKNV
jgi:hypothetical protein